MKKNKIYKFVLMLTIVRIIGIPLIFCFKDISLLIYLNILFITDFWDGYLARKYNVTSTSGALLDLLADKVLVTVLLIYLTMLNILPLWITILLVVREIYSMILRIYYLKKNKKIISASIIGKSKTALQFVAIDFAILNIWGYKFLFVLVIILSYISIFNYIVKGWKK